MLKWMDGVGGGVEVVGVGGLGVGWVGLGDGVEEWAVR